MKRILLALSTIAMISACGTAKNDSSDVKGFPGFHVQVQQPDMYVCSTKDGITASYTTTSMTGKPEMQIQSAEETSLDNVSVLGDEIEKQSLADGSFSVSAHRYIPDFRSTTWTLVIPQVQIQGNNSAAFEADLTELVEPTTIMGPVPGQKSTTTVRHAKCEASFVNF